MSTDPFPISTNKSNKKHNPMKKNISKLNQIRLILGLQTKFETATLIDGVTQVEADSFAVGAMLYVVDAAGNKTAAPEGTHETADLTITVDAAGVITSIVPKIKEDIVNEPVAVAAAEEMPRDAVAQIVSEVIDELVGEDMRKMKMAIEQIMTVVEEVKTEMGAMKEKYSKFAKEPAATPLRTAFQVESFETIENKVSALAKWKKEFDQKSRPNN
jgi:hypothetical protein